VKLRQRVYDLDGEFEGAEAEQVSAKDFVTRDYGEQSLLEAKRVTVAAQMKEELRGESRREGGGSEREDAALLRREPEGQRLLLYCLLV
jgi:hypothetical protein